MCMIRTRKTILPILSSLALANAQASDTKPLLTRRPLTRVTALRLCGRLSSCLRPDIALAYARAFALGLTLSPSAFIL
jgi:hypothetical protein